MTKKTNIQKLRIVTLRLEPGEAKCVLELMQWFSSKTAAKAIIEACRKIKPLQLELNELELLTNEQQAIINKYNDAISNLSYAESQRVSAMEELKKLKD